MTATATIAARHGRLGPGSPYHDTVHANDIDRKPGQRYGRAEPRLVTPPLRDLTVDTSLGYSVIRFADDVLGVTLLPWQRALLIRALELRPDGLPRFRTVVVLVGRQNGKSLVAKVLALWWLYVCDARLVLGTAQDLDTAEETWAGAVEIAEETEVLAEGIRKVHQRNGHKALELTSGARYRVKAANRSAGRGLTGHRIILDELREHQNWDAWAAISKTTMAVGDAQIWGLSNAGDISSVVLRYLRMKAHDELGDPDGVAAAARAVAPTVDDVDPELVDSLDAEAGSELLDSDLDIEGSDIFLAEWSAAPGCSLDDRDAWAQGNPSMGWMIDERTIASARRTDPEWVFRVEVLCQWPGGGMVGPFKPGSWEATANPVTATPSGPILDRRDWITSPGLVAAVAVAPDRSRAHIAIAGHRDDGLPQVEIHATRHGIDWVRGWLMDRRDRIHAVTGQTAGEQVSDLMHTLDSDPGFLIPVVAWRGRDLMAAHGLAYDLVRDGKVRHCPQQHLDLAASSAARKSLGGGWVISLPNSPTDAAPLQAWIGALWLLHQPAPEVLPPAPPAAIIERRPANAGFGVADARDLTTIAF